MRHANSGFDIELGSRDYRILSGGSQAIEPYHAMGNVFDDIWGFIEDCVMAIVNTIKSVLATLVRDISNPLALLKDFINMNVELITGEAAMNFVASFPMTRWLYLGIDNLEGGFLTKLDNLISLPEELTSGQPITRAMVLGDLATLITVIEIVVDVFTMNFVGLVGIEASLLMAGPLGRTTLGKDLLGIVAIGASAMCGDGDITQAFIDAGESQLQKMGLSALAAKIGAIGGALVGAAVAGTGAVLSSCGGASCETACAAAATDEEDPYGTQTFDFTPEVQSGALATQSTGIVATKAGVNPLLTAAATTGAGAGISAATSCCTAAADCTDASDDTTPPTVTAAATPVNLNDPASVQAAIDTGATVTDSAGNEIDLTDPEQVQQAAASGTAVSIPAGTPVDLTDPCVLAAATALNAPVSDDEGNPVNLSNPCSVAAASLTSDDAIPTTAAAPAPTACQLATEESDETPEEQEDDSGMTDAQIVALLQVAGTLAQLSVILLKAGKTPKQIAAAQAQATRLKPKAPAPKKTVEPLVAAAAAATKTQITTQPLVAVSTSSNTLLYVGAGVAALTALLLLRKKA